jgi:hypothetical protein
MSRGTTGLLLWLISAASFAHGTFGRWQETLRKQSDIRSTEPHRPNGPARRDNITDEEVREVQHAALEIYPDAIVNISTVTNGCECEEGGNCTAQVWLVLYRPNRTRGLMLSKIGGHWQIGAVQKWWLRYYDHRDQFPGRAASVEDRAKLNAWRFEEQELLGNFPVCTQSTPASSKPATPNSR